MNAVQIRRNGPWMYPVHEVPLNNVVSLDWPNQPALLPEVRDWLESHVLTDERYYSDWVYYCYPSYGNADFFFKDPNTALLFKLTWG